MFLDHSCARNSRCARTLSEMASKPLKGIALAVIHNVFLIASQYIRICGR